MSFSLDYVGYDLLLTHLPRSPQSTQPSPISASVVYPSLSVVLLGCRLGVDSLLGSVWTHYLVVFRFYLRFFRILCCSSAGTVVYFILYDLLNSPPTLLCVCVSILGIPYVFMRLVNWYSFGFCLALWFVFLSSIVSQLLYIFNHYDPVIVLISH